MLNTVFRKHKAVTLTELLVVLAIVALLATMAVPVYINQIQRARIATAQAETRQIAEAMQACAITHGFLVPIHVLNNIPNRESGTTTGASSSLDDFDNMSAGRRFVIDITRPLDEQTSQLFIDVNSSDHRVQALVDGWQGPFLNPKRLRYVGEDPTVPGSGDLTEDLVADPWGNPYRVYSERGLLGGAPLPGGPGETLALDMDDLELPSGSGAEVDRFDRFAIVSYGPDGRSGFSTNPLDQGDDVHSKFAITVGNESRYQFF